MLKTYDCPDEAYHDMMAYILEEGDIDENRTGIDTLGVVGVAYKVRCGGNRPALLRSKHLAVKTATRELQWFLSGKTNLRPLLESNVNIWTQWVKPGTEVYDETGKLVDGDLGPIYQHQWRNWKTTDIHWDPAHTDNTPFRGTCLFPLVVETSMGKEAHIYDGHIDQLANVTNSLRNNPESRRHLVSAWNPADLDDMALPPCHVFFQFVSKSHVPTLNESRALLDWSREASDEGILSEEFIDRSVGEPRKLDIVLYMRSNDTPLGHAFNVFQYSTIMLLMARSVGMVPGDFIYMGADVHMYEDQVDIYRDVHRRQYQSGDWLKVKDEPRASIKFTTGKVANALLDFKESDIALIGYNPLPSVKYPIAAK